MEEKQKIEKVKDQVDKLRAGVFEMTHHIQVAKQMQKYDIDSIKLLIQTLEERRWNTELEMYNQQQLKLDFNNGK